MICSIEHFVSKTFTSGRASVLSMTTEAMRSWETRNCEADSCQNCAKQWIQTKLGFPRKIVILLMANRNPATSWYVSSLPHYLQGFIHSSKRWLALGFSEPSTVLPHLVKTNTTCLTQKRPCSTATLTCPPPTPLTSTTATSQTPHLHAGCPKPCVACSRRRRRLPTTKLSQCEAEGRKWSTTRKRKVGALHSEPQVGWDGYVFWMAWEIPEPNKKQIDRFHLPLPSIFRGELLVSGRVYDVC